jgi:hypothetical protein
MEGALKALRILPVAEGGCGIPQQLVAGTEESTGAQHGKVFFEERTSFLGVARDERTANAEQTGLMQRPGGMEKRGIALERCGGFRGSSLAEQTRPESQKCFVPLLKNGGFGLEGMGFGYRDKRVCQPDFEVFACFSKSAEAETEACSDQAQLTPRFGGDGVLGMRGRCQFVECLERGFRFL